MVFYLMNALQNVLVLLLVLLCVGLLLLGRNVLQAARDVVRHGFSFRQGVVHVQGRHELLLGQQLVGRIEK